VAEHMQSELFVRASATGPLRLDMPDAEVCNRPALPGHTARERVEVASRLLFIEKTVV